MSPLLPLSRRLFYAFVAVVPFLSVYVAHCLGPGLPTGFIQYDQAYYSANGREIFERGNGWSYPNPYDPDPAAPAIYFHWFPWLLGFGIKKLGLDPGVQYVGLGILSSLLCAWFTWRLIEAVVPDQRGHVVLYFFTMWGGGALCLAGVVINLLHHRPLFSDILRYDPFNGWWFLNWGRNLVYSTEALYHALVAATWLAVLSKRWMLALLGAALLAGTHPFSGLQLLLIVTTWFSILVVGHRTRPAVYCWVVSCAMLCLFLWYYGVFLESFVQHHHLRQVWALKWNLSLVSMIGAYAPVGFVAGLRIWFDRGRLDSRAGFLATCFLVSFVLAKHDWFIKPHQPLHFTHGYVWMPLCLLALPALQRWLLYVRSRLSAPFSLLLLSLLFATAVFDNLCFLSVQWRKSQVGLGHYLSAAERETFQWMDSRGLDGVLLCPYPNLSYLSATYTSVRPYYGHGFNTPDFKRRTEQADAWFFRGQESVDMSQIDYVLVKKDQVPLLVRRPGWERLHENGEWVLWQRMVETP